MVSKGSQTRRHIVEQALQLFSVKGYYNTSISDIQAATGLTKGGLYGHFAGKEDIWYAVYEEAVAIWKAVVFKNIRGDLDPLERIAVFIRNDLEAYLGGEVFDGGCFFLNMLVELTGQSAAMSRRILRGFVQMSRLLRSWLQEAQQLGRIRPGLDLREVANFIVIALNGAAALYIASRDRTILRQTSAQLAYYIDRLANEP